jgi:outer membrane protein insertion porin family
MGYQVTESLRQTLRYTLRSDEIKNIRSTASRFIQDQEGTRLTSLVGQVLFYDKRDNRLEPTEGYFAQLGTDFAGIGGDVDYIRAKVGGGYYYPVAPPNWVASFTGEVGYVIGIGQDVKIQDRFFIGGDTLRGFKTGGIGPRDHITNDALGGNQYFIGSASLTVPLGLPQELGFSGRVFSDFGTLYGVNEPSSPEIDDKSSIRMSVGTGVSWRSPLGPIRLDFAIPVIKEDFDKTEVFRVSFGTRF